MDMPSSWLQEQETQDQGFLSHEYHMNKPYYYYYPMEDFSVDSFSSDSYTETPSFINQSFQPHKCFQEQARVDIINNKMAENEKPKPKLVSNNPSTFTISFGDVKPKEEFLTFNDSYGFTEAGKKNVPATARNPVQAQDHVLAERKRREKLAQRFVSLFSLLPDQKKSSRKRIMTNSFFMDKATVLEDATNYIQKLENRVKELERKNMQESVLTCKRSRLSSRDDNGSSSNEENFEDSSSSCNPEIEVRTSGSNLLVEIFNRKKCISLVKVLSEMQKLGLSIISCSTMPFADTILLVTIVSQKNDDFVISSADIVKNLQLVI